LSQLRQNGYVVADLGSAIEYWTGVLGVGPFFIVKSVPLESFSYGGQQSDPQVDIAITSLGSVQIELIHQRNGAPSPYRDFLSAAGPGLHHCAVWSRNLDGEARNYLRSTDLCLASGEIVGLTRFCYVGADRVDGTCLELIEETDALRWISGEVARIAATWSGEEPVRDLAALTVESQDVSADSAHSSKTQLAQ
jgi:hypothetical protein